MHRRRFVVLVLMSTGLQFALVHDEDQDANEVATKSKRAATIAALIQVPQVGRSHCRRARHLPIQTT